MLFILEILFILLVCVSNTSAEVVPSLNPGFFFGYSKSGQSLPIPVTEQCEAIKLSWRRGSMTGPNPTAPYYLQVYTSRFTTPFVIPAGNGTPDGDGLTFNWQVPFAPGTQYQICMFDKFGVSGGCQAMYTVIQNSTTPKPTCLNVTAPPNLEVSATVLGRPMAQYGFIDQCTDVTITPKSGKPPFTLTVAPAFHPPFNITSNSMDPINWTVSLTWAFPFFLSLVSADGLMWSNGPMHAGPGPDDCLAPDKLSAATARGLVAGTAVGSAVVGVLIGIASSFFLLLQRHRKLGELYPPPPEYEAHAHPLPPVPVSIPFPPPATTSLVDKRPFTIPSTIRSLTSSIARAPQRLWVSRRSPENVDPFTTLPRRTLGRRSKGGRVGTFAYSSHSAVEPVARVPGDLAPVRFFAREKQ